MATDLRCQTPFGDFRLQRYPARRDETLQAWCAADMLLLEEVQRTAPPRSEILVVNDEHGALSVALQPRAMWTDSALAAIALQVNLAVNHRAQVPVVWSTAAPPAEPSLVVLRVPKQLSFFEYQLVVIAGLVRPGTTVLAAGMDKHLSPRVAEILQELIGPTERHRGQRKARLFSARRDARVITAPVAPVRYHCDALEGELEALPNVFSRDRLDGGSRLLLGQLSRLAPASTLVDLACGNGVLGLVAFKRGLAPGIIFADESAMALASARGNAERLFPRDPARFDFCHDDGLAHYDGPPPDLVLCNPPFHLNHAVEEFAGRRLIEQCAHHMPAGGRLCLVANQHLDYLPTLRHYFGRVSTLARDRRFIVWLAERS